MSNYYDDIYLKRLNRYGLDYQSRLQNQRERNFEEKLLKSIYRVDFEYNGEIHPATLERYKQDETQLLQYLLTRVSLNLPNGTILMIPDKDEVEVPWMVYWLESIKASGYNRYIVLKMTHYLTWRDRDKNVQNSWAYMFGQQSTALRDTLQSSSVGVVYGENQKENSLILPQNIYLNRDDYIEIGEGELKEAYVVTGYDIQSTPGVEYVTLDPVYLRDTSPAPQQTPSDSAEDFYWLNGGDS